QGAFKRLNPNTSTFSSGNVTLTRLPLRRQPDLVWLRRETRTAAEQCGLDDRSVQSLSAASYEAARLLFAQAQNADAEISLTPPGELQVSIRTGLSAAADRQAVGRSVSALATVLHHVSVEDSGDALLVTLSASVPFDAARAAGVLRPMTT